MTLAPAARARKSFDPELGPEPAGEWPRGADAPTEPWEEVVRDVVRDMEDRPFFLSAPDWRFGEKRPATSVDPGVTDR